MMFDSVNMTFDDLTLSALISATPAVSFNLLQNLTVFLVFYPPRLVLLHCIERWLVIRYYLGMCWRYDIIGLFQHSRFLNVINSTHTYQIDCSSIESWSSNRMVG
jgi:hypothetical protein